jgi:hypothetical protein
MMSVMIRVVHLARKLLSTVRRLASLVCCYSVTALNWIFIGTWETRNWLIICLPLWKRKLHFHVQKRQKCVPVLSHLSPAHTVSSCFLTVDFSIALQCEYMRLRTRRGLFVLRSGSKALCMSLPFPFHQDPTNGLEALSLEPTGRVPDLPTRIQLVPTLEIPFHHAPHQIHPKSAQGQVYCFNEYGFWKDLISIFYDDEIYSNL